MTINTLDDPKKGRLEIFIDGTNFFCGKRDSGIHYDLNISGLGRRLSERQPGYLLTKLRFYTAPVIFRHSDAYRRQERLFEMLRRSSVIELVLGRHEARGRDLNGKPIYTEKETDVNIALHMQAGAYEDRYDTALLITGDSDLAPAARAVRNLGKKVIWGHFITQKNCVELQQASDEIFMFTEAFTRTCRIPDIRR